MATASPTITFASTSDALFRVWGSGISSALSTAGLVQSSDTGQINWTTITRSNATYGASGAEVLTGYEIWKFNDSLQSTKPVYIKIEYGYIRDDNNNSSNGVVTAPAMYVTVSNATNGAGTLNGSMLSTRQRFVGGTALTTGSSTTDGNGTASGSSQCYFSGDGSYINVALGATTGSEVTWTSVAGQTHYASFPAFLVIERTRGSSGTTNGNGVVFLTSKWTTISVAAPGAAVPTCQYLSFASGAAVNVDSWWPFGQPGNGFGTGTSGSNVYFWPLAMASPAAESQSLAVLAMYNGDVAFGTSITVNVLGATHTYISMSGLVTSSRNYVDSRIPSQAILLRYE